MSVLAVIPCLHCAIQPHQEKSWSCCPQPNAINTSNLGMVSILYRLWHWGANPISSNDFTLKKGPKVLLNQRVVRIHRVLVLRWHAQPSTFAGALLTQIHRPGLVLCILSGATNNRTWPLEISGQEILEKQKNVGLYHPKKWWFRVARYKYICHMPHLTGDIVISSVSPWRAGSLPNGTRGPSFRPRSTTSSCERHKNTSCLARATGHGHGPRPRARSNVHDGCTYVYMYIIIYIYVYICMDGWMDGLYCICICLCTCMCICICMCTVLYCTVLYCIVSYCMHAWCMYVRTYVCMQRVYVMLCMCIVRNVIIHTLHYNAM